VEYIYIITITWQHFGKP